MCVASVCYICSWTYDKRNNDAYLAYNKPGALIDWLRKARREASRLAGAPARRAAPAHARRAAAAFVGQARTPPSPMARVATRCTLLPAVLPAAPGAP